MLISFHNLSVTFLIEVTMQSFIRGWLILNFLMENFESFTTWFKIIFAQGNYEKSIYMLLITSSFSWKINYRFPIVEDLEEKRNHHILPFMDSV